jgi:hypothetical protein
MVRSNGTSVSRPYVDGYHSNQLPVPAAGGDLSRGQLARVSPPLRGSHVQTQATQPTELTQEFQHFRRVNSTPPVGVVVAAPKETTTGVRKPQPQNGQPESCPTKTVVTRAGSAPNSLARKRSVHWAPRTRVIGSEQPGILHHSQQGQVWTAPFVLHLTICGQPNSIHYAPTRAATAEVNNFEKRLVKAVHAEHTETLMAFLKTGYTLSFGRLSRISNTVIPADDPILRRTAFRTFLNAVFRNANVELS